MMSVVTCRQRDRNESETETVPAEQEKEEEERKRLANKATPPPTTNKQMACLRKM